jgi:hypothetical protein
MTLKEGPIRACSAHMICNWLSINFWHGSK